MKNIFTKVALVALLAAPLALAACSSPAPESSDAAQQSSSAAGISSSAVASAATASATPEAGKGSGPVADPKSEILLGLKKRLDVKPEYAALSDACKATADRMIVGMSAPLAVAMEDLKPGNVQKAKEAIAEVQGTTPAELEPTFAQIEAMADKPSGDFDETGFETAFKPVVDWLSANCNGFSAAA